jgi:hypothetical protein
MVQNSSEANSRTLHTQGQLTPGPFAPTIPESRMTERHVVGVFAVVLLASLHPRHDCVCGQ